MQFPKQSRYLVKLIFFTVAFVIIGNRWLNESSSFSDFVLSKPALAQTTQVANLAASHHITLTQAGILPQSISVLAGAQVVWYNATGQPQTLRSGVANRIFLPLIQRNGGGQAQNAEVALTFAAPALATVDVLSTTIASGASFTYSFAQPGVVDYYLLDLPHLQGKVIVEADTSLPPDPVDVAPPLDQTVSTNLLDATSFLFTGNNPIQTGVLSGTIELRRVAVLRGRVLRRDGSSLPGVTVSILDHPEFGQTLTRADGMFDMAVNGGGQLTVDYSKADHLPIQRQVQTPWQDYSWLPDVVMITQDPNVMTIDLAANIPIQVARGSIISDTDGMRQKTLFFPQGTTAVMSLTNGTTQTLTLLHVRSTEYTVGANGLATMPAALPANSAYTYASELSVDEAVAAGATNLSFNQPIISYHENFLNFPVGANVPLGYYDRSRGVWISADNGRVIKLLSITSGLADLDIDGSGAPANVTALGALGVTAAERATLASLYAVGQSLWRTPIAHFTTWDENQATSCDEPCPNPNVPRPKNPDVDKPVIQCGSIIGCQNQTLGEVVDVTGTPFYLHYQSDRVAGYRASRQLLLPLSGPTIAPTLKRIELEVAVAGQVTRIPFQAVPNLSYTYTWNGRDAYGRTLQGKQPVTVRLSYVYRLVYKSTDRFGYSGLTGILVDTTRAFNEFIITRLWNGTIGDWNTPTDGLGGWSLDVHHVYDPGGQVLYLGDSGRRSTESLNFDVITTAAGDGISRYRGDGGLATQAGFVSTRDVAVAADGSVYIADEINSRIRRIAPSGFITTVAGTGTGGYSGDGGPATQAQFSRPRGIAVGSDGGLYIADQVNHRIRRVGANGIVTTIAGNGTPGYSGDGGLATSARLYNPASVALDQDGNLYIADSSNQRIRRVGTDGIITTVVGDGGSAYGDGIPAIVAALSNPFAVAVGPDGSLYIVDETFRIRRVGVDGIITTVAGTGAGGNRGDGGPATQAQIRPRAIAIARDGSFYIADLGNHTVRHVGTDGIINPVAGNQTPGYAGDGGPATQARLYTPSGVAVGPDGSLYIADSTNYRIRRVDSSLAGFALGDIVIPAEDGSEVYVFNNAGRHLRTLDALTKAVIYAFAYDNRGSLISVADGEGNTTTITRDANGKPTSIVGPYGQTTTLTLDGNGYFAAIRNPANEAVQLRYTADGLLTQLVDPRGNPHTFTYDAAGRLISDANPAAGFLTLARVNTGQGYTVTVRTALTRTTTYAVENLPTGDQRRLDTLPNGLQNELLTAKDGTRTEHAPDGTTQHVTLAPDPRWGMLAPLSTFANLTTPSGLIYARQVTRSAVLSDTNNPFSLVTLTELNSSNGRTYSSAYTAATRTLLERSPSGRAMTTTLDGLGRVVREQEADLLPVSYSYDPRGQLIMATLGTGAEARVTSFSYDSAGYLASVTDPLGRSVQFEYDAAGRLIKQTQPDSRMIGYAYDANGNLTSLTPPGRPAHTFSYTPIDLTAQYSPPDVNPGTDATQYNYNADRQLTQVTRPDGQTMNVGYDGAGRLNSLTIARGMFGYTYNPTTGNLATISAPSGSNLNFSDDGGLLTGQTWTGPVAGNIGYSYDNNLRRTAITVNGSNVISYSYDNDSLLTSVGALTLNRNIQNGLLTGSTLGSVSDGMGYSGFGEPISYTARFNGAALLGFQYEYDKLGRIVSRSETINGATNLYVYGYDQADHLATVRKNGATISTYSYDANGNRLSYQGSGPPINGTYDSQDRLLQYGNATYTYSANGELRSKTIGGQVTTYIYDELGNLVSVTLPDTTKIDYLIDGLNRRIGKKVNGVLKQGFLLDGQLRIVAELDGAGNVVSRFVYATHVNVPDTMIKGGVTYRILTDHLGSPRLVVNAATGAVAQAIDFDEFGRVLSDTNAGFQPFGFAGGLYDRDTKLVRFGARDYDAESGRWTVKDPTRFRSSDANLYGYVHSDPLNRIDPIGLWGISIGGQGGAGLGAGAEASINVYIGTEGVYYFHTTGGGFIVGAGFGASVSGAFIWDIDNVRGHGTEWGVDIPLCGAAVYQSDKDGQSLAQGPVIGVGMSVGPSVGLNAHLYKTYTWDDGGFSWHELGEGITHWIEQAGREIQQVYGNSH